MDKAHLFKTLNGDSVQCLACSHYCNIKKDNVGICGVRKNIDGELVSLVANHPIIYKYRSNRKKTIISLFDSNKYFFHRYFWM